MGGSGGGSPPKPPKPAPVSAPVTTNEDENVKASSEAERRRLAQNRGRLGNLLFGRSVNQNAINTKKKTTGE